MICEEVLGNLHDQAFVDGLGEFTVDWVDFDWHEVFKRVHRKVSEGGLDVGVRLDDGVLSRGLSDGDVLGVGHGADGGRVALAVRLLPTKCLVVDVAEDHPFMLAKVGWEVGNTHTPLFFGEGPYQVLCEYTEPVERLLCGLHAVSVRAGEAVLDPARRVSASAHHHHHGEGGGHAHAHTHGETHEHERGEGHAHAHGHCHEG